jgi:hypothetical protein
LNANPEELERQISEDKEVLTKLETFDLENENSKERNDYKKSSLVELHELLESAVQEENYEKAARIRDEISKRES